MQIRYDETDNVVLVKDNGQEIDILKLEDTLTVAQVSREFNRKRAEALDDRLHRIRAILDEEINSFSETFDPDAAAEARSRAQVTEIEAENQRLTQQITNLRADRERLSHANNQLAFETGRLRDRNAELKDKVDRVTDLVQTSRMDLIMRMAFRPATHAASLQALVLSIRNALAD